MTRLHQLLRVADLLDDERDVERRTSRHASALAVDAVLSDHRERVGEQIHRDRETAATLSHHRLVDFERLAVLVERAHVTSLATSCRSARGRISTRLGRLRAGWSSRSTTTCATSSGDSFQSAPAVS